MGLATESARAKSLRRFDGQVAIVTGAAQGIGWAIAQRLGSEGAAVLLADINGEGVHRRAEELEADGTKAAARQVDVGLVADVEGMVGDAVGRWGRLDMLVNNAFPALEAVTGGAEDVLPEDYDKAINLLPSDNPMISDIYNAKGAAYNELGQYQRAIEDPTKPYV